MPRPKPARARSSAVWCRCNNLKRRAWGSVLRNVIGRKAIAIIVIALASGLISTLPPFSFSMAGRSTFSPRCAGRRSARATIAATSPVAVIAIDEETYQTPPFKGSPTPTWTTEIGRVLTAVLDGGARVAGFDIVFANSIEQSELPFGDASLGSRMRGFDRPFLLSLQAGILRRQGRARRDLARRRNARAFARATHRGWPAKEYPPAQYLHRPRRGGAKNTADISRQWKAGAVDGAGAGLARAKGRTGVRR